MMADARWPRGLSEPLAAEYVGLSVTTVRTLRTALDFPAPVKLTPGRIVFLREDLDAWLDRRAGKVTRVDPDEEDGSEWLESLKQVK